MRDASGEEFRVGKVWHNLWEKAEVRHKWSEPSPEVVSYLSRASAPPGPALDVGCGIGRHIPPLLAMTGFVVALDYSAEALRHARERNPSRCACVAGSMFDLPFPDRRFSVVLAFNVVYHASLARARRAIRESIRCCLPGGLVLLTLISTRNKSYSAGLEIEPRTFVCHGEAGDRGLIHHFFSREDVVDSVADTRVLAIEEFEPLVNGMPDPGGHHWFALLRA